MHWENLGAPGKMLRIREEQWEAHGCSRRHGSWGTCSQWQPLPLVCWVTRGPSSKNAVGQLSPKITYMAFRPKQVESECFNLHHKEPWPWPWSAYLLTDGQRGGHTAASGCPGVPEPNRKQPWQRRWRGASPVCRRSQVWAYSASRLLFSVSEAQLSN